VTNRVYVVTEPPGVGRRRVVADFTSHDSRSLGGAVKKPNTLFAPFVSPLIVHVAGQGGDFDAPGDLVIAPNNINEPMTNALVLQSTR